MARFRSIDGNMLAFLCYFRSATARVTIPAGRRECKHKNGGNYPECQNTEYRRQISEEREVEESGSVPPSRVGSHANLTSVFWLLATECT